MAIELGDGIVTIKGDTTGFNKSLDTLRKQGGKSLVAFGAVVTGALALAVRTAADFEQAITNAAAVTGTSGKEFDKLKETLQGVAQELGQSTVFSAKQAAAALLDLARKGFDVANISAADMKGILDLAAATNTDLAFTTELVTSTLNQFGLEMSDSGNIADIFTKAAGSSAISMRTLASALQSAGSISATFKIPLEELVVSIGKLLDVGIDASTAGTGLRKIIVELVNPTSTFAGVLKDLGLQASDLDVRQDGLIGTFGKLTDAGITAEQVMESFGLRGGPVALALFKVGDEAIAARDKMNEFVSELENSGGVAEEVADKQLDTLSGQLKLLGSAFEAVLIPLGQALIPGLTSMTSALAGVLQGIAKFAVENKDFTGAMVKIASVVGIASAAFGTFLLILPTLITSFTAIISVAAGVGSIITGIGPIVAAVAVVVVAAALLIIKNWDKVVEMFLKIKEKFQPALDDIKGLFTGFVSKVVEIWGGFVGFFRERSSEFGAILNTMSKIFVNVFGIIASFIEAAVIIITSVLESFGIVITESFSVAKDGATSGVDGMISVLGEFLEWLEEFSGFIEEILQKVIVFWHEHSDTITSTVVFMVNRIIKPIVSMTNVLARLFGKITSTMSKWAGSVRNIFGGVANFIRNTVDRMLGWIGQLINAFRRLPGVGSGGVPGFAAGTMATNTPFFMAGEGGKKELIGAPIGSRVFNAGETANILASAGERSGGEQINNTITGPLISAIITKEADVDVILRRLERKMMESRLISGRGERANIGLAGA